MGELLEGITPVGEGKPVEFKDDVLFYTELLDSMARYDLAQPVGLVSVRTDNEFEAILERATEQAVKIVADPDNPCKPHQCDKGMVCSGTTEQTPEE